MKYLPLLLLLAGPAVADIESVRVGTNTLIVEGDGLLNIRRATLARKPLIVTPISETAIGLSCKCKQFPVGTQRLRLFKPLRKFQVDVTITGQELSDQPPVMQDEKPQPVGEQP